MKLLIGKWRHMRAAEILKYTVRPGDGAGSGVPEPEFLHMNKHFRSFLPGRSAVFFTNRDPPI
jgi:hypothetical protein